MAVVLLLYIYMPCASHLKHYVWYTTRVHVLQSQLVHLYCCLSHKNGVVLYCGHVFIWKNKTMTVQLHHIKYCNAVEVIESFAQKSQWGEKKQSPMWVIKSSHLNCMQMQHGNVSHQHHEKYNYAIFFLPYYMQLVLMAYVFDSIMQTRILSKHYTASVT